MIKRYIILYKNKIIILNSMKHIFMQIQQNSKRIHQIKGKIKVTKYTEQNSINKSDEKIWWRQKKLEKVNQLQDLIAQSNKLQNLLCIWVQRLKLRYRRWSYGMDINKQKISLFSYFITSYC